MNNFNKRIEDYDENPWGDYRKALPLLRDMAQALSEAQAENERLNQVISALTYSAKIARMTTIPDTPAHNAHAEICTFLQRFNEGNAYAEEMEKALSANEILCRGVRAALQELEAGKPGDAESILERVEERLGK